MRAESQFNKFAVDAELSTTPENYFRYRDFEYAQPLYDLAFLLELAAAESGESKPKYRTFALWKAAISIDSYDTRVDQWLEGEISSIHLDHAPSARIRAYLASIRQKGSIAELDSYLEDEHYVRALRLRSLRGLGPAQISQTVKQDQLSNAWLVNAVSATGHSAGEINATFGGTAFGTWQRAHVIPPLLRILRAAELLSKTQLEWSVANEALHCSPLSEKVIVSASGCVWNTLRKYVSKAVEQDAMFSPEFARGHIDIKHVMGWRFRICKENVLGKYSSATKLAMTLDPLATLAFTRVKGDLHAHSSWSDGAASPAVMANAAAELGLQYIAITDHSRTSKLQRGLTPVEWLRQASALKSIAPQIPILHGIEVDILQDGSLDLPYGLLDAAEWVVASVHSNWATSVEVNTRRLTHAIESGKIDTLGHPTSALIGKPGVPNYIRRPAIVDWSSVFDTCARWQVAVEFNCFPSRFDLPIKLLQLAQSAGCWISFGSDAHARAHLLNLRFGDSIATGLDNKKILNCLSYDGIKKWLAQANTIRTANSKLLTPAKPQSTFDFIAIDKTRSIKASLGLHASLPSGSAVLGIDLTGSDKPSGIAFINENYVDTTSLKTDDDIVEYVVQRRPRIVSIDSPLGLPGGGDEIDPKAGIVRQAEHDLSSIGISAYPALIDSMRQLTLRGIQLRKRIEALDFKPLVIESYPGAAQDILCLPRKQYSLGLLKEGLQDLGLRGPGLLSTSHDEIDAITSAVVGRYFESGQYEPMGIESEAQLIVPKHKLLNIESPPVVCLSGKTGVGKSVVARYLAVVYGFQWIKTRELIRALLVEDCRLPVASRIYRRTVTPESISEADLRDFGVIILERYNQEPLRQKLSERILASHQAVVVDSIRDTSDLDLGAIGERTAYSWFVDASDALIQARLNERSKRNPSKPTSGSGVDQWSSKIKSCADHVLKNDGTLEELRWRVDDTFFDIVRLNSE